MVSSQERSSASPTPLKRRREHENEDLPTTIKKKKSKHSKPSNKRAGGTLARDLDLQNGLNNAIGKMDSQLLADFLAQQTQRHCTDLSTVELQDLYLPYRHEANAFYDTSTWSHARTADNLPQFLREQKIKSGASLSKASKAMGCPHTIVVTSAGLRAADLSRALRVFQTKESAVVKLFAKHVKLREAIEHVKKTRMGIGIGTPTRLIDLLNAGALDLKEVETIVLDGSHIDQKQRGVFDMKDTHVPLMRLLTRTELCDRYGSNGSGRSVEILVF